MEDNKANKTKITKEEIERYCRQIILPELGPEGQEKILKAKVLVIGAGGLGSPCLMYLSGAGVGEIGIIDGDCVDTSNLHRQIIHTTSNKGVNKAKSAAMMVNLFNPLIKVNIYEEHLTRKNAIEICKEYDILVDCCDNPATRYLTNDVSVVLNKPLVSGAAVQWEGQLAIYVKDSIEDDNANKLPCYRCLFPLPTPSSAACNCSDAGVFGPVPGVIGTLQANETIKLIIGANDKILAKRMLNYDAYEMTFKIFKLRKSKDDCIACGDLDKRQINKDNLADFDYDEFVSPKECRIAKRADIPHKNNMKWPELIKILKDDGENNCLIDVRPSEQFKMFNIEMPENKIFTNVPLKELTNNFANYQDLFIDKKSIFVLCRAGNQSTHAAKLLIDKGYNNVYNIQDGLHGYIKDVDSNETPFY